MKIILQVLLLLAVPSIYAQHTLQGNVIDSQTNEPLAYVNIYIPQLEKSTATDETGKFILKNIPSGNYKIVISMIGYETVSQSLQFPNRDILTITLTASAIEMEEIIVSTPFHKLQSENVMKVEHEKVSDLKAKGAVTLADGIASIAGVENISTGLSVGKPVIRGLSSNRVLVYAQGVRLENQQFGDEHGLGLSSSGVESVEVIKGPASLLYGSDALGGVLYINPEKFAQANTATADAGFNYFTNTEGINTGLGFKSSDEHFKFLFRGNYTEHSDYNTSDYRVTNTRFKEQDFKAGFGYQKSQFKTELRYNINKTKLGIPEEIGLQSLNITPLEPYQDITNHILSSKSTIFFNNSSLDVNLGLIYNDRKEFGHHDHDDHDDHDDEDDHEHDDEDDEHHDDEHPALHMKLKTFNYDIKYHLPQMGKFETIIGVQGMHQTNTNYGEELLIPDASTNDFGVLATSHIHFEKADVQLGLRYDTRTIDVVSGLSKSFNSFNGAVGVKADIFKQLTARLNLATGFRAPNLAELTSHGSHHGTNRYEIGNENLKNEQNFQIDLAVEFKNKHVEVFVNGFYNLVNDYIFLSPTDDEIDHNPVFLYTQDDARLYGGEIGLHFHPHPLDWLHFESSFETVTGKQSNDAYLPLIPANSLHNTVRVEFQNKYVQSGYAFVKLSSVFNQNNVSAFETTTDGYNLLSAGFGGSVKVFNNVLGITVSGTNLTDTNYISHLSRLKHDGIFNIGRNFNIGLTYTL